MMHKARNPHGQIGSAQLSILHDKNYWNSMGCLYIREKKMAFDLLLEAPPSAMDLAKVSWPQA